MMNHNDNPLGGFEPTREDVLIGRVVDGEASAGDWDSLEGIARTDGAVWERLGHAQRAHARLEREVDDAIALAELIDVPSAHTLAINTFHSRLRQYAGWAAAAVVAVAWLSYQGLGPSIGAGQVAGVQLPRDEVLRQTPPEQLLAQYVKSGLAKGRVLGEMPTVFVDSRDLGAGQGKEVWFLRQILERIEVTDMAVVSVQMDEHGTQRFVPLPGQTPLIQMGPAAPVKTPDSL